jgi:phage gpG-like protein
MSGIRVVLKHDDQAFAQLHAMGARLDDARPMYDEIGAYLDFATSLRFETGIDPEGNPWPKSWRAINEGGKTLVDSARLKQSLTHNAWATGVEHGTNVEYAASHQFGATIKAKTSKGLHFKYKKAGGNQDSWATKQQVTLPRRAFIGIDDEDMNEIMHIAERYVGGADAR